MSERTWSAAELRALGVELPEHVPGHATIPREQVWFLPVESEDACLGVVFTGPLTWEEPRVKPIGEA